MEENPQDIFIDQMQAKKRTGVCCSLSPKQFILYALMNWLKTDAQYQVLITFKDKGKKC